MRAIITARIDDPNDANTDIAPSDIWRVWQVDAPEPQIKTRVWMLVKAGGYDYADYSRDGWSVAYSCTQMGAHFKPHT